MSDSDFFWDEPGSPIASPAAPESPAINGSKLLSRQTTGWLLLVLIALNTWAYLASVTRLSARLNDASSLLVLGPGMLATVLQVLALFMLLRLMRGTQGEALMSWAAWCGLLAPAMTNLVLPAAWTLLRSSNATLNWLIYAAFALAISSQLLLETAVLRSSLAPRWVAYLGFAATAIGAVLLGLRASSDIPRWVSSAPLFSLFLGALAYQLVYSKTLNMGDLDAV